MKKHRIKIFSVLLALVMCAGLCACGRPRAKDLKKIVLERYDAEEVDPDDIWDLEPDDFRKGVVLSADGKELDDLVDEFEDSIGEEADPYGDLLSSDIMEYVVDPSDVKVMSAYIKSYGDDDILVISVMHLEETDDARDSFDTVLDTLEDKCGIKLDRLGKDEYRDRQNAGHIIINLDRTDLIKVVAGIIENAIDSVPYAGLIVGSSIKDMKKQLKEQFGKDQRVVYAVYFDGETVVTAVLSSDDEDALKDFGDLVKAIHLTDPLTVNNSKEMLDGLADIEFDADELIKSYGPGLYDGRN